MVFTTSEKVAKTALTSCEDPEAQHSKDMDSTILVTDVGAVPKRGERCSTFPWILVCICMVLLLLVSGWGWNEHFKLVAVLKLQEEAAHQVDITIEDEPNVTDEEPPYQPPIPYGDDAHYAEDEPKSYDTWETHLLFIFPFLGGQKEVPNTQAMSEVDATAGTDAEANVEIIDQEPEYPDGTTGAYDDTKVVANE